MMLLAMVLAAHVAAAPSARVARRAKAATAATQPVAPALAPSPAAQRVIDWVMASGDNHALPWAVVDKQGASLFLFDGKARPLGAVPVLIGIAPGDDATPGVGNKRLSELGPAEKTTPAGRFLAKFSIPVGRERVLWVDYATSVALHAIPKTASPKERRGERMKSATPEDNRITFGCINVPNAFYQTTLRQVFRGKGGYVYVLPDSKPLEDVFPLLRSVTVASRTAAEPSE